MASKAWRQAAGAGEEEEEEMILIGQKDGKFWPLAEVSPGVWEHVSDEAREQWAAEIRERTERIAAEVMNSAFAEGKKK